MDDSSARQSGGEIKPGTNSNIGSSSDAPLGNENQSQVNVLQDSQAQFQPPKPPMPPQAPDIKPSPPSSQVPPTSSMSDSQGTVTTPPDKPGVFRIFVIIAIIVILIIYAVVVYLFFQNRNLADDSGQPVTETIQIIPTPEFTPDQIQLIAGNIVRVRPTGEESVIINKDDYTGTGITGFAKVVVSPDNSKICFESWPPAPEPALYIANVDGTGIAEVSPNRQGCVWSEDSDEIYYLNRATGSQDVDIYSFSLSSGEEINLTAESTPEGETRLYEIVGLSADSSKIICRYDLLAPVNEDADSIECEIDLTTGDVTILE